MIELSAEDAQNAVVLLDRVTITGHQERAIMNTLVGKLNIIAKQLEEKNELTATDTNKTA